MAIIDGFEIEPHTADTFLFRRVGEPHHEYEYRLTSKRVELLKIVPAAVGQGDPDKDAKRYGGAASEVAKRYRNQLFPKA